MPSDLMRNLDIQGNVIVSVRSALMYLALINLARPANSPPFIAPFWKTGLFISNSLVPIGLNSVIRRTFEDVYAKARFMSTGSDSKGSDPSDIVMSDAKGDSKGDSKEESDSRSESQSESQSQRGTKRKSDDQDAGANKRPRIESRPGIPPK